MPDLFGSKEIWIAFGSIILTALTGGLGAWWKLRQSGVNATTAAEITDRAAFRKHLLEQVEVFRKGHEDCLARETALRVEVAEARAELAFAVKRIEALEQS